MKNDPYDFENPDELLAWMDWPRFSRDVNKIAHLMSMIDSAADKQKHESSANVDDFLHNPKFTGAVVFKITPNEDMTEEDILESLVAQFESGTMDGADIFKQFLDEGLITAIPEAEAKEMEDLTETETHQFVENLDLTKQEFRDLGDGPPQMPLEASDPMEALRTLFDATRASEWHPRPEKTPSGRKASRKPRGKKARPLETDEETT